MGAVRSMDIQKISMAIGAHGLWKSRLREAIERGCSEHVVEEICCDDSCDFGRWLYALSGVEQAGTDWKKVRELHAEFHKETAVVLAMALAGRKAEAGTALGAESNYVQTSLLLTAAMMDWMNHVQKA